MNFINGLLVCEYEEKESATSLMGYWHENMRKKLNACTKRAQALPIPTVPCQFNERNSTLNIPAFLVYAHLHVGLVNLTHPDNCVLKHVIDA